MKKHQYVRTLSRFIFLSILGFQASMLYGGELPEKCRLVPVNGTCKAMMDKYYFDQKTGRCTEYFYDGCGPVVPFDTMEECRALCEPAAMTGEGPKTPVVEKSSGLAHDPVEDDPRYAEVFKNIDDEVKGLLADHPQRGAEGFVNIYWNTKKRVLKEKYGIDWRSPGELNPHVLFD